MYRTRVADVMPRSDAHNTVADVMPWSDAHNKVADVMPRPDVHNTDWADSYGLKFTYGNLWTCFVYVSCPYRICKARRIFNQNKYIAYGRPREYHNKITQPILSILRKRRRRKTDTRKI